MKQLILIVAICMITVFSACSLGDTQIENTSLYSNNAITTADISDKPNQEVVFKKASYSISYKNIDELEEASDLVVKVTVLSGSEEIRSNQPNLNEGIIPIGYVLTPVKIDAIYKSDGKHSVGDIVKIEEYYSTAPSTTKENTINVYSGGFYLPMIEAHQYILFLKEPQNLGDYEIVRYDLGKYVYNENIIDSDNIRNLSNAELEVGIQEGSNKTIPKEYYDIAEQVIEKYNG